MYAAGSQPHHPGLAPPFVQDSPYLFSPHAPTPTPPRESHFDPRDPAWFTPQVAPPSTSQFGQGAFDYGYGDEEQEVLAFGDDPMEPVYEPSPYRRHSEGGQPTSDRLSFGSKPHGYDSASAQPTFFDSGYTLAPVAAPSAAPSSVYVPAHLAHGEVSPSSASFPRMTREHWQAEQQRPRAALVYGQDYSAPHDGVDESAYSHCGAYSTVPYTPSMPMSHSPYQPAASSSSSSAAAPRTVAQPIPQRALQHAVLVSPTFSSSAPDTPIASPFVGFNSPSQQVPASARPLRPGLVRAHTNASPEFVAQPHMSPVVVAPTSVPRHNSWSSPQQEARFDPPQQVQGDMGRRASMQPGSPVAYAPYPSAAARRRSSQAALQQEYGSPVRASGMTWTPSSSRRSSGAPSAALVNRVVHGREPVEESANSYTPPTSFDPATPTSCRTSYAPDSSTGSPAHPHRASPAFSFSSRRPHPNLSISVGGSSSRRSSAATSGMGAYRSPHYSPFSPSSPYTTSSSINTPATIASGCSSAMYPLEQYSPAAAAAPSMYDAHGRRYTDPYAMSVNGAASVYRPSSARRSHEQMRRATIAAAPPASTTMASSSLSGFASHAPLPHSSQHAYGQEQAYAGADESMGWSTSSSSTIPPTVGPGDWSVMAPVGSLDVAADGASASLPLDGTVGLGLELEMGLEEVRLAVEAACVAPDAMYGGGGGRPGLGAPYDARGVLEAQQEAAYQELLVAESRALARRDGGQQAQVQREVREYLAADNGMALGEKTVVVMNPKIAQRSYGTEKRLLAPPPMALLLGSSWWSTHASSSALSLVSGKLPSPDEPPQRLTLAPEVFLSISTDKVFPKVAASSQWITDDGKLVLERTETDSAPLAGRAMSKSLAVNVTGELNKDVSTTVTTVVTLCEPGEAELEQRVWARFVGKPISVISKPSKKRAIVSGNIAGLNHGSIVSLYNRTKTYSGSTRYLCTSGIASMFPTQQWAAMTGGTAQRTFAPDARDLRLVSKTSTWDAFVVYAVNVDGEHGRQSTAKPQPGFPPPPSNALSIDSKIPRSLYYNQTVVLQDLATGVVSPVLVLRKVDAGNVCSGGGSLDTVVPPPPMSSPLHPTLPGEHLGEPVSQYRPIALEVACSSSFGQQRSGDDARPRDSFLGVIDDEVGMYQLDEARTYVRAAHEQPSLPITPTTPLDGVFSAMQQHHHGDMGEHDIARVDPLAEHGAPRASARPRAARRPSAEASKLSSAAVKSKRRGMSAAALAELTAAAEREVRGAEAGLWTLPLGEGHVWSMVQVEVERHTFFVPPSVDRTSPSSPINYSTCASSYRTPRPRVPIGPDVPTVCSVDGPLVSATRDGEPGMLVVRGRNFSPDLAVWIGDSPCAQVKFRSSEQVLVHPPPATLTRSHGRRDEAGRAPSGTSLDKSRRIALVRPDGVVFPSQVCC